MAGGSASRYSRLVHKETTWWGTYPVPLQLRVGDYVQMDKTGKIKYLGSVLNWPEWEKGLPVEPFTYKGQDCFWKHVTTKRAADAGAGVETAGVGADASLTIAFSEEAGFLLNLDGTTGSRFKSVDTARRWILGLAKNGQWEKNAALITEVIKAKRTTVLIAEERETSFRLQATASLPLDVTAINLADPALHVAYFKENGSGYSTPPIEATPLYHCARIRRRWYGPRYAELQTIKDPDLEDIFIDDPFIEGDDHTGDDSDV
jgi:hypothetical protein